MNKLDLIIDEIMQARMFIKPKSIADFHTSRALAAARELRNMKPVGVFAYDEENKVWEELIKGSEGTTFYTLGDTDEQIRSD